MRWLEWLLLFGGVPLVLRWRVPPDLWPYLLAALALPGLLAACRRGGGNWKRRPRPAERVQLRVLLRRFGICALGLLTAVALLAPERLFDMPRQLDRRQRGRLRLVTHRFRQLAGGGPDPDRRRLLRPDLPHRPLAAAGGGRAHAVWSAGVLGRHRRVFLPRAGVSRRRGSRCCSHARRGSGQHRRGPYSGPAPLGRYGSDPP